MRRALASLFLLATIWAPSRARAALTEQVNPLVGTAPAVGRGVSPGGGAAGNTYPGAALPFGMMQWSPDTENGFRSDLDQAGSYVHADKRLRGFGVVHMNGPGCPAYGDLPILPIVGLPAASPFAARGSPTLAFTHEHERASPGRYSVTSDDGVDVALTVNTRSGIARFTFPPGATTASVLFPVAYRASMSDDHRAFDAHVEVVGRDRVVGWVRAGAFCNQRNRYTLHFVAVFDREVSGFGAFDGDRVVADRREQRGSGAGAYVQFALGARKQVQMKLGLSYVDAAGAARNLAEEIPGFDFDAVAGAATRTWEDALSRARVEGGDPSLRRVYYTALYHALLQPNVFSDRDGRVMGFDDRVHDRPAHTTYANFSGWDVYRSQVQLLAVLFPQVASDLAASLIEAGHECGAMPQWASANGETTVMIGQPAAAAIASVHAFGARGFDAREALRLMVDGASRPNAKCQGMPVRDGVDLYLARGHIPLFTMPATYGVVSRGLEYNVADFAIATLARTLRDEPTAARFFARAASWRTAFNADLGVVQPRLGSGRFMPDFEPFAAIPTFEFDANVGQLGFVEGNAAQYTWMVPHDVRGLSHAIGGEAAMRGRLDRFFTELNAGVNRPFFYIGNEPLFGAPWLYDFIGAPASAARVVRETMLTHFRDDPAGLPGNDDLGATSSWYVWGALGLYPAIPGVAGYAIGTPLFPTATLRLPNGKAFVVRAPDAGREARYATDVRVGGKPLDRPWLDHGTVARGGQMTFALAREPSSWGTRGARPPSFDEGARPVIGFVAAPGILPIAPGEKRALTLGAVSLVDRPLDVEWSIASAGAASPRARAGRLSLPAAGRKVTTTVDVEVPATAAPGCVELPVLFRGRDRAGEFVFSEPAQVMITADPLAKLFNRRGIAHEGTPAEAELDGAGHALSAEALAAAGLSSDRAKPIDGLAVRVAPGCGLDNVVANGQTVEFAGGLPERLGLLVASVGGEAAAELNVRYDDGHRASVAARVPAWDRPAQATPGRNVHLAASTPTRLSRAGRDAAAAALYLVTVPSVPGRRIAAVTLPQRASNAARLHVFAIAQ